MAGLWCQGCQPQTFRSLLMLITARPWRVVMLLSKRRVSSRSTEFEERPSDAGMRDGQVELEVKMSNKRNLWKSSRTRDHCTSLKRVKSPGRWLLPSKGNGLVKRAPSDAGQGWKNLWLRSCKKTEQKVVLNEEAKFCGVGFGRLYGDQQFASSLRVRSLFHSCWWQAVRPFLLLEVLKPCRSLLNLRSVALEWFIQGAWFTMTSPAMDDDDYRRVYA